MWMNLKSRFGWVGLAMLVGAAIAAPAAQATPVTYDFTVEFVPFWSGPLQGAPNETGSFTFDSSSITPGTTNYAPGLLTSLDFWHNGIHYDETTANTGYLYFGPDGDLWNFVFGTNCSVVTHDCYEDLGTNQWSARFGLNGFIFAHPSSNQNVWTANVTFALVPYIPPEDPTSVPEPGTLGLFGLGALIIGVGLARRRRFG